MDVSRILSSFVRQDLARKLVLISGPRQVGKTTLARSLDPAAEFLNYATDEVSQLIAAGAWIEVSCND